MSANICPICSGEIMTYRRFMKEAEPSGISVCQCCGARLRRSRGASPLLVFLGLGATALSALAVNLAVREMISIEASTAIVAALAGGYVLLVTFLGRRLAGWVVDSLHVRSMALDRK